MRKPHIAQADPATDLRQRAARARDAAGRFIKRTAQAEPPAAPTAEPQATEAAKPDPAIAVAIVYRASWDALARVLNAEVPDELVSAIDDAHGAAYERLRTVRPTTAAGHRALAECWALALEGERGDEPGITLADHAADSLIAGAGACVPINVNAQSGSPTPVRGIPDLVDLVDLASATIDELRTIKDVAKAVGSVAYAHSWRSCCHRSPRPHGFGDPNDAGRLMTWLGDALTEVEAEVDREVARRVPENPCDREMRLVMRAVPIIENGDLDGIEAFARELLDHTAAEREGR